MTLRFSQTYLDGTRTILGRLEKQLKGGETAAPAVELVRNQLMTAELQVREATQALAKTQLAVALILNLPLDKAETIQPRDAYRDLRELPSPQPIYIDTAWKIRPDLLAIRLGVKRAEADIVLAKANRYPDAYLLYQPYTFQNNTYLGVPSAYSWTLGITASMPVFNRNQGNIARAKLNLNQTALQSKSLERQVVVNVINAIREFELSRLAVIQTEKDILPRATNIRDSTYRRWTRGDASTVDLITAQKDLNDVGRGYRDSLIRHRRAMFDLNTAVGVRLY